MCMCIIHTDTHRHTHAQTRTDTDTHRRTQAQTQTHRRRHTHTHTHTHTNTQTHTHTQTHKHTGEINTNTYTVNVGLCHNSRARVRRVHRQPMRADLAVPHAINAVIRTAETRGSPNEYKEVLFRHLGTIQLVLNSDASDRKGQRCSSGSVDAIDAQERHGRRRREPKIYRNSGRRVRAVAEAVTDFV